MATFWGKNKHISKELEKRFEATKKIGNLMWIDETNDLIAIAVKDGMKPKYIFEVKDFKGYAVSSNQKEIGGRSGLGRAVGGGLLFGPTGAIVGAITGRKDSEAIINSLLVKIEMEHKGDVISETIPVIYMRKVKLNSTTYKFIEKEMADMVSYLDSLLDQTSITD